MSFKTVLSIFCLFLITDRSDALLINSANLLGAAFQPWLSTPFRSEDNPATALPEVKHLTTASYKGINYVMVTNVSLGFAQAERYCATEFSDPMHLASILSEEEWHMLATVFGTPYPSEVWLGGTVQRSNSRLFILHWIDASYFTYHRFPVTERKRWMTNWRVNSHGCITGNLQSDGHGNWSAELTPCTEPRGFVCKEVVKSVEPPAEIHRSYGLNNFLASLLFPSNMLPFKIARESMRHQLPDTSKLPTEEPTTTTTTITTTMAPMDVTTETTKDANESNQNEQLNTTTEEAIDTTTEIPASQTDAVETFTNDVDINNGPTDTQLLMDTDLPGLNISDLKNLRPPLFTIYPGAPLEQDNASTNTNELESAPKPETTTESLGADEQKNE